MRTRPGALAESESSFKPSRCGFRTPAPGRLFLMPGADSAPGARGSPAATLTARGTDRTAGAGREAGTGGADGGAVLDVARAWCVDRAGSPGLDAGAGAHLLAVPAPAIRPISSRTWLRARHLLERAVRCGVAWCHVAPCDITWHHVAPHGLASWCRECPVCRMKLAFTQVIPWVRAASMVWPSWACTWHHMVPSWRHGPHALRRKHSAVNFCWPRKPEGQTPRYWRNDSPPPWSRPHGSPCSTLSRPRWRRSPATSPPARSTFGCADAIPNSS